MTIARADWPRLLALVDQALELPPAARHAWVSGQDLPAPLHGALLGLLEERRAIETGDFLAALPSVLPAEPVAGRFTPGSLVGPWRLLRELGQGGMSTVWLAERADAQLTRQVALKLPHAGPGQDLLAARLLRERNILAALEHPNIARLYDVGLTDAGTPYLVMEYVAGDTLLAHADRLKLTIAQRLALFQQVLRAVQYAHGKLVLHRDLKPSNILVNEAGDVKLLDFGIAKFMEPSMGIDATLTQEGHRLFTLHYSAPEQLRGESLDVRCDVYSLGVLLYELLTGQSPYSAQALARVETAIAVLSTEPRPASEAWRHARPTEAFSTSLRQLHRALRNDLDAILAKALAKAPAARYDSVEALHEDLNRHLRCEPVLAAANSTARRAIRFVKRYRRGLILGSGAVAAVALGAGVTVGMAFGIDTAVGVVDAVEIGPKQSPFNCALSSSLWTDVQRVACREKPRDFFGSSSNLAEAATVAGQRGPLALIQRSTLFSQSGPTILKDPPPSNRLVLRAQLRLSHPELKAQLWMRVDTDSDVFYMDNSSRRNLARTTEWQEAEVEVVLPKDAIFIGGGVFIRQSGAVEMRDLRLQWRTPGSRAPLLGDYFDPSHPESPMDVGG